MKKLRRVNTAKRKKQRKEAQQALAKRASSMLNHPMECCVCETAFERNKKTVKTWQVTIREERVRLTCPSCWSTIQEMVEDKE